jgi:hypothetical protein
LNPPLPDYITLFLLQYGFTVVNILGERVTCPMFKIDTVKTVADLLYEKKLINADQLAAIKFENVNTGKSIEQIIKERGYVNSEEYAEAFGEVYGIPFISLTPDQADPKLLELIPITLSKKYKLVPFELKENRLCCMGSLIFRL